MMETTDYQEVEQVWGDMVSKDLRAIRRNRRLAFASLLLCSILTFAIVGAANTERVVPLIVETNDEGEILRTYNPTRGARPIPDALYAHQLTQYVLDLRTIDADANRRGTAVLRIQAMTSPASSAFPFVRAVLEDSIAKPGEPPRLRAVTIKDSRPVQQGVWYVEWSEVLRVGATRPREREHTATLRFGLRAIQEASALRNPLGIIVTHIESDLDIDVD